MDMDNKLTVFPVNKQFKKYFTEKKNAYNITKQSNCHKSENKSNVATNKNRQKQITINNK